MNRARAAAARAKLHEAIDELFDAIEDGEVPEAAGSRPRPRRDRRPRALTRPPGEATPEVAAKAARILRERGFDRE